MKEFLLTEMEWEQMRLGRITSSNIGKLMETGTKGNYFGKGALSYIDDLIAQRLIGYGNDISGLHAIEWGNDNEPLAYERFKEVFKYDDADFYGGNQRLFLQLGDFIGGSPDFIATKDGKIYIGEIKCPYSTANHVKHLQMHTLEDLKEVSKSYHAQLQFNMLLYAMATSTPLEDVKGIFLSFDPRIKDEKVKHLDIKILEVEFDVDFIELSKERAEKAILVMKEKMNLIYKN